MTIELVATKISPDILDTMGKNFNFRHGSGVAEWLKNALDNYLRLREMGREPRSGAWPVLINLIDGAAAKTGPNLAVIDFGGTTLRNIDQFFLHWGSRSAVSLGHSVSAAELTGGHGNGGKFYMRQMWRDGARLLSWRDGSATSLVVQLRHDGNTGYWEIKDQPMPWRTALDRALSASEHLGGAEAIIGHLEIHQHPLIDELESGMRGFTAVVGRRAVQVLSSNDLVRGGKWDHQKIVDAVRDAPQARRPIAELSISIYKNGVPVIERLVPEAIDEDPDWTPEQIVAPAELGHASGLEENAGPLGTLRIRKAANPLIGRLKHRNSVTVLDASGNPIASYHVKELPLAGHSPLLDFIFGELTLTFDGVDKLIQYDRERLVPGPLTETILGWTAEKIWTRVSAAEEARRTQGERKQLEVASILNDQLNRHAKQFLEELQTQMFVDVIQDPTGGGAENGESKRNGTDGGKPRGDEETGGKKEVPGTTEQVRRPRFPQVLLSDHDADPATGGTDTKHLTDRHPPLEQDDVDRKYNVWWINTQHVFAQETMKRGGAKGLAFRNYQLHMFRDVVQREALRYRQRREAELPLDRVENELTEISNRFLAELPHDLVVELLD